MKLKTQVKTDGDVLQSQEDKAPNGFVRFWRRVYRPLGFHKGYNFPLCKSSHFSPVQEMSIYSIAFHPVTSSHFSDLGIIPEKFILPTFFLFPTPKPGKRILMLNSCWDAQHTEIPYLMDP